ncbi:MAG TPA: BTAD domain-containing putative transcriptional regulator [Rhizomicrobium sp.]
MTIRTFGPCLAAALLLASAPAGAKSLEDLRDEGYALAEKNDCAHAYPIFLEAAAKSKGAPEDNLAAANCAVELKRNADAIAELRLVLARRNELSASDRIEAMETFAYQLEDAGRNKEAAEAWDDALTVADTGEIRMGSARAWKAAGDDARADKMLASIDPLSLSPALQAEYWSEKSERLIDSNPQAALDAINRAIAIEDADYRRVDRAEALTKLGRAKEAIADLEMAHKQKPDDASTDLALAYAYQEAGRSAEAVVMFDAAAKAGAKPNEYAEDWGYALAATGRKHEAVAKFKLGIDDRQALADTNPPNRKQLDQELWDARQEVQDIERTFSLSGYFNYRSDALVTLPLSTGTSVLQNGTGLELDWRTPFGLAHPNDISLFAGAFWSFKDKGIDPNGRSGQGALGVQWKPFEETDLTVSFARYIKIGSAANNGWVGSADYSGGIGTDWNLSDSSWNYFKFDADTAYLFGGPDYFSASAEGRAGRAFDIGPLWAFIPHVVIAGQLQDTHGNTSSLVEAGAGFALRHWFCEDKYKGPECGAELTVQYRYPLSRDGLGKSSGAFVAGVTFDR